MFRLILVIIALITVSPALWLSQTAAQSTAQSPKENPILSPRLKELEKSIASGNQNALGQFWQEITQRGTPLVEPLPGDQQNMLVTFLWRGDQATQSVIVAGGVAGPDFGQNQLAHLAKTDVWYRSYRTPRYARFTYIFSINAEFKLDPLNSHRVPAYPREVSAVELPDAPPQPWSNLRPGVPAGRVEKRSMKSAILNNERDIFIYTPPGYRADGEPYHLLVVFDGGAYIEWVPTPVILDNLLAEKKLPPFVAVVVANASQELRGRELPCYAPFAEFLAKELVPWVRANYRVTTDPQQTVVAGSSYGGLASAYMGFTHPEIFGNILSQSGAYWWKPEGSNEPGWLIQQYVKSPQLRLRFYMDVGLFENFPTRDNGPSMVNINRHLRDVLRAKGYPVTYREFAGGHEYFNWRGTLADGLLALMEPEKKVQ